MWILHISTIFSYRKEAKQFVLTIFTMPFHPYQPNQVYRCWSGGMPSLSWTFALMASIMMSDHSVMRVLHHQHRVISWKAIAAIASYASAALAGPS
jgi:hypothetical protein